MEWYPSFSFIMLSSSWDNSEHQGIGRLGIFNTSHPFQHLARVKSIHSVLAGLIFPREHVQAEFQYQHVTEILSEIMEAVLDSCVISIENAGC